MSAKPALNAMLVTESAKGRDADHLRYIGFADRIQRSTGRMRRLIGDLLDVVSLEAGRLDIAAQTHDVRALLRDTADVFSPQFSAQGIVFRVDMASDTPMAEFDHERILQVLGNLLSNAQKFTAQGGEVAVRVAPARRLATASRAEEEGLSRAWCHESEALRRHRPPRGR